MNLILLLAMVFTVTVRSTIPIYPTPWPGTQPIGEYYTGAKIEVQGCVEEVDTNPDGQVTLKAFWFRTGNGFILAYKETPRQHTSFVTIPDGETFESLCFPKEPNFRQSNRRLT